MANYAVGDIQGCWDRLKQLLKAIKYNPSNDRLWCVGDLVNRGSGSLEVIEFLMELTPKPIITLGNHDLYLLRRLVNSNVKIDYQDTLSSILDHPNAPQIRDWLRQQHILYVDDNLNVAMAHAGIPPIWNIAKAQFYASKLEQALRSDNYIDLLNNMYGNEPTSWEETLSYEQELRFIVNGFTRMRYLTLNGALDFSCQKAPDDAPSNLVPWYNYNKRIKINYDIVFGHWASLNGQVSNPQCFALDTGCVWGGKLTALRLEDKTLFQV